MSNIENQRQLYLVCNAHIDPVWLWEWEEGAASAMGTFRVAAQLCEEFDAFVFNHNEVILYEWVQEYESSLFEHIKDLVKRGKTGCRQVFHARMGAKQLPGRALFVIV